MNKLFTILLIALLTLSCNRKALPAITTDVKDSTVEKATVTRKDSTFSFSPMQASLATTIDSLLAVVKRIMSENKIVDSTNYGKARVQNLVDTTSKIKIGEHRSGDIRASIWVDKMGNLLFNCNTDSLKKKITWLETELRKERYYKSAKTISVPTPVPTPYISKWILWTLGISLAVNAWVFRAPVIGIVKHIFKKW